MPFIPPGYAQANHNIALTGDPGLMMVTLGIKFDAITLGDLEDVANSLFDSWADSLEAHISNAYSLMGVTLYANLTDEQYVVDSTTAPRPGLNTGAPAVQNTAILIKKRTAQGGRANRGRMYHPGVPEPNVGNTGGLTSGYMSDVQAAATFWLGQVNAVTNVDTAVVLHAANIPIPTPITSFAVDGLVATQRRRLR